MCTTCGCSGATHVHGDAHTHDHVHPHPQLHPHETHAHSVERALLEKNDQRAAANRRRLAERGMLALNLVSSPGAGKTTLLERTIGA
jgi:hydrogenase nickel incorporation protein HypB